MIINQKDFFIQTNDDTVEIIQGARWNSYREELEPIDAGKDVIMIQLVNNASETGYVSFQRAPKGGGPPVFSEFMRLDASGNLILTNCYIQLYEITKPASPAANTLRLYATDDTGTTKLAYVDSNGTESKLS